MKIKCPKIPKHFDTKIRQVNFTLFDGCNNFLNYDYTNKVSKNPWMVEKVETKLKLI